MHRFAQNADHQDLKRRDGREQLQDMQMESVEDTARNVISMEADSVPAVMLKSSLTVSVAVEAPNDAKLQTRSCMHANSQRHCD